MKIVTFLLANIGRVHVLDAKIRAAYDLWTTIYDKLAPLLPQHVAATAAVASAQQEQPDPAPETVQEASE